MWNNNVMKKHVE